MKLGEKRLEWVRWVCSTNHKDIGRRIFNFWYVGVELMLAGFCIKMLYQGWGRYYLYVDADWLYGSLVILTYVSLLILAVFGFVRLVGFLYHTLLIPFVGAIVYLENSQESIEHIGIREIFLHRRWVADEMVRLISQKYAELPYFSEFAEIYKWDLAIAKSEGSLGLLNARVFRDFVCFLTTKPGPEVPAYAFPALTGGVVMLALLAYCILSGDTYRIGTWVELESVYNILIITQGMEHIDQILGSRGGLPSNIRAISEALKSSGKELEDPEKILEEMFNWDGRGSKGSG